MLLSCSTSYPPKVEVDPNPSNWQESQSYAAQILIAETAFNRGDYDTAFAAYRKAATLTKDTEELAYINNRAVSYDQFDLAAEVIDRWMELEPDSDDAYVAASVVDIHLMQLDDAAIHLAHLFELRSGKTKTDRLGIVARITAETLSAEEALDFYYRNVVSPNEGESNAWLQYAQIAEHHERLDVVEMATAKNLELNAGNPQAALLLFKAKSLNNDEAGAERVLTDFLTANEGESANAIKNELVRIYFAEGGRDEEALEFALDLIEEGEYFPRVNFTAVLLAQRLQRKKTLANLLAELINSDITDSALKLSIAEFAIEAGQFELATKQLDTITNPEMSDSIAILRGEVIGGEKGIDQHIDYLRAELDIRNSPSPDLINSLFYTMSENDREEEALEFISEQISRFPNNSDLLYTRGLHLANNGVVDAAIDDFEYVIDHNPQNAAALNALGYTLADNNLQLERALTLIERAAELQPESAFILDSLGWVHFRLGNYEIAAKYLQEAYQISPQGDIKAHLAELFFTIGETDKADRLLSEALEEFPDNEVIIDTHRRLKD